MRKRSFKSSFHDPETHGDWYKTETGKGYAYEQLVANMLKGQWQGFSAPFDILWGKKKIDVKTCNLYKRKRKQGKEVDPSKQAGWFSFHKFDGKSKGKDIDYLFCIGLLDGIPWKMWLIPYQDILSQNFTITSNASKRYDKYLYPS